MKRKSAIRRSAFTLIEVTVVIMILITLAGVATPIYMNYVKKAKVGTAKTQVKLIDDALTQYKLDLGNYPGADAGLQALVENVDNDEKWGGPYLKPAVVPKDPWGNEYVYTSPGEHGEYDLTCYGADGEPGGSAENADINSLEL